MQPAVKRRRDVGAASTTLRAAAVTRWRRASVRLRSPRSQSRAWQPSWKGHWGEAPQSTEARPHFPLSRYSRLFFGLRADPAIHNRPRRRGQSQRWRCRRPRLASATVCWASAGSALSTSRASWAGTPKLFPAQRSGFRLRKIDFFFFTSAPTPLGLRCQSMTYSSAWRRKRLISRIVSYLLLIRLLYLLCARHRECFTRLASFNPTYHLGLPWWLRR